MNDRDFRNSIEWHMRDEHSGGGAEASERGLGDNLY